jgi:hypothetical protein
LVAVVTVMLMIAVAIIIVAVVTGGGWRDYKGSCGRGEENVPEHTRLQLFPCSKKGCFT